LANNHMMDFGPSGLETTLKTLDTAGIKHAGAGATLAQALQPALIERKGLKIALLGFLVAPNITTLGTPATENTPGVAPVRGTRIRLLNGKAGFAPSDDDLNAMEAAIKEARKTADVVAVTMHIHWGDLEAIDPEGKQLITRAAIDAGADIVLGHGPHVVNGIEFYKGKPIIYSMGNFAFQFDFGAYTFFPTSATTIKRLMGNERLFEAMMVRMILSPQGKFKRMELLPLGLTKDGDPHFVAGDGANSVLDRVKALSEPFGTAIKREAWYAVVDLPK
ncbi:MAG: CapA family protein, partial [Rhodospirillaceae bacterium]